jgi:hypothetical protein
MGKFAIGLFSILAAVIVPITAADLKGLKVYQIKVDYSNPSWSYFRINPIGSNGAEYGPAFVFDIGTDKGKSVLSLLLAAKATGGKVTVSCTLCTTNPPGQDFGSWGTTISGISFE